MPNFRFPSIMGCTSSAPNMANSHTAEKSIQFENDNSDDQSKDEEEIIYRAANEINVLPTCDTIPEPLHLVRNKSTPSLEKEKDNSEDRHISESINKVESNGSLEQEEKASRLQKVVDKFVGFNVTEHIDDTQAVEKVAEEPLKIEKSTDKHSVNVGEDGGIEENKIDSADGQDKDKEDASEEALSPSQSESSRATRWEALADIAAELPPSHTVDPTTGQILSLFK